MPRTRLEAARRPCRTGDSAGPGTHPARSPAGTGTTPGPRSTRSAGPSACGWTSPARWGPLWSRSCVLLRDEAGDVLDLAHALVPPRRLHPHARPHPALVARVDRVEHG